MQPRSASATLRPRVRQPKGYLGIGHEIIGSDIASLVEISKLPQQVLSVETASRITSVEPDGWYPVSWLIEAVEVLDRRVGYYGLLRMGRALFKRSHAARVGSTARSAADIIYGIDAMYRHANRGVGIGGWRVLKFESGYAELEKTTPHHCVMEQGVLTAGLVAAGCPCIVSQRACFRNGADACTFTITSGLADLSWFGATR